MSGYHWVGQVGCSQTKSKSQDVEGTEDMLLSDGLHWSITLEHSTGKNS